MTSSIIFKRVTSLVIIGLLFVGLFSLSISAADIENGSYTVDYLVKKAEDDSVSMANDYFEKPAKVDIDNGQITVSVTMNHSEWITEFKTPAGGGYADAQVIQTNEKQDKRTVRFNVPTLKEPLLAKIHVTVPSIDYDHDYTIRFVFNSSKMTLIKAKETPASKPDKTEVKAEKTKSSPAVSSSSESVAESKVEKGTKESSETSIKTNIETPSSNNALKSQTTKDSSSEKQKGSTKEENVRSETAVSTESEKEDRTDQSKLAGQSKDKSTDDVKSSDGTMNEETNAGSGNESLEETSIQQSEVTETEVSKVSGQSAEVVNTPVQSSNSMELADKQQADPMASKPANNTVWWYLAGAIVFVAAVVCGVGFLQKKKSLNK